MTHRIIDTPGAGPKPVPLKRILKKGEYESRFYPLNTAENCVECIAAALWSGVEGILSKAEAKMAIDAAAKAARILNDKAHNSATEDILKGLAVPSPADKGEPEVVLTPDTDATAVPD